MAKAGKLSMADMRKLINKRAGMTVAHNLNEENPTEVNDWIPTGSRWLDSIICKGKLAGIPVGKVTEIAGLEATGKSYMAAQVAANAQKMGIDVIYFDSESAIDPTFLERAGCHVETILYVQAQSVSLSWRLSKIFWLTMKIVCFSSGILLHLHLLFPTWKETLIHSLPWQ